MMKSPTAGVKSVASAVTNAAMMLSFVLTQSEQPGKGLNAWGYLPLRAGAGLASAFGSVFSTYSAALQSLTKCAANSSDVRRIVPSDNVPYWLVITSPLILTVVMD